MPPELGYALIGIVLALIAVVVWLIVKSRGGGAAADGAVIELRLQLNAREQELKETREALKTEGERRVAAETQAEETRRSVEEQRKLLEEAKARLTDTFKALSSDALRGNAQEFVQKADDVLTPLKETLTRYERSLQEMNQAREGTFKGLTAHIDNLLRANQALQQQTDKLAGALRSPMVRGKWGEIVLDRVLELSGLGKECIEPQGTVSSEEGRLRPDVVVRLPGERCIVVDAKVPLSAYMDAMETEDADVRQERLSDHAAAVRSHMRQLATKGYWKEYHESPDLVIMFLPAESFLSAALSVDSALIEDGVRNHVILATPTALVVTLSAVAYSWQQQRLTENARNIADTGKVLYERLCVFMDHLAGIGGGLEKACDAYNKTVRSWESRLQPTAQKFKDLGVAGVDQELPELPSADAPLRQLPPAEGRNDETRITNDDSSPPLGPEEPRGPEGKSE